MKTTRISLSLGDLIAEAFDLASRVTQDPERAAKLASDFVADALVGTGRRDLALQLVRVRAR